MSALSKITLPNNTTYDLKDAAKSGVYTVVGTQTESTGSWTGNINIDSLYDGLTIAYYLPYAGSGSAILNLTLADGETTTGAINCYYQTSTRLSTQYPKGSIIWFTYFSKGAISIDGAATADARWISHANYDTNTSTNAAFGQGYVTCSTAAGTAAKVGVFSSYALVTGGIVSVYFENDVPANSTLNINSKGAKPMTYRGSAITAGIIRAGDTATFMYDGSNYLLISINRSYSTTTTTIGSASEGTAISADDITNYTAGTAATLSYTPRTVRSVKLVGSVPSLTITSTECDDITSWETNTPTSASVQDGVLTISEGSAAALSYTARAVGSASGWSAGSVPTVEDITCDDITGWTSNTPTSVTYTSRSIPNISVSSKTVVTSLTTG